MDAPRCRHRRCDLPQRRPFEPGEYTSITYTERLEEIDAAPSIGTIGDSFDNAVAESFFASLKTECIHRQSWATRAHARRAAFDYIEVFFNRQRLHSALNYLTPVEYETKISNHTTAHAA